MLVTPTTIRSSYQLQNKFLQLCTKHGCTTQIKFFSSEARLARLVPPLSMVLVLSVKYNYVHQKQTMVEIIERKNSEEQQTTTTTMNLAFMYY
jgi:putative aminopeptidase FrvX